MEGAAGGATNGVALAIGDKFGAGEVATGTAGPLRIKNRLSAAFQWVAR